MSTSQTTSLPLAAVRIKNARLSLELSQSQLAERCEVTPQTIYKYESGRVENIPLKTLERFAEVLGVSPAYLAGWTNSPAGTSVLDIQVRGATLLCATCPICGSLEFGPKHGSAYGPEARCSDCGTTFRLDADQFPLKTVRLGMSLLA